MLTKNKPFFSSLYLEIFTIYPKKSKEAHKLAHIPLKTEKKELDKYFMYVAHTHIAIHTCDLILVKLYLNTYVYISRNLEHCH